MSSFRKPWANLNGRAVGGWMAAAMGLALAVAVGTSIQARGAAGGAQAVNAADKASDGYYTEAQAKRGRVLFYKYCALCHEVDANNVAAGIQAGRGSRSAPEIERS